ncbi:MAG: ABC transporter substrate-binding protein [Proteobacteria bacterium]|nr:ABC transporter substrate-binding protein [Pseudomonadota bacterium]
MKISRLLVMTLLLCALGANAFAGPATDVVKAKQTTLFDLLKAPKSDAKKVDATLDDLLDYAHLTEASLGSEWAARTDKEKAQFAGLLKQLVRAAHVRTFKKIVGFDVAYVAEDASGDLLLVKTKATSKTNPKAEPIELAFRMAQQDGKWLEQDLVTDNVSLVSSYRSQFTKIVKNDGFPKLVAKMKDKLAKGE